MPKLEAAGQYTVPEVKVEKAGSEAMPAPGVHPVLLLLAYFTKSLSDLNAFSS